MAEDPFGGVSFGGTKDLDDSQINDSLSKMADIIGEQYQKDQNGILFNPETDAQRDDVFMQLDKANIPFDAKQTDQGYLINEAQKTNQVNETDPFGGVAIGGKDINVDSFTPPRSPIEQPEVKPTTQEPSSMLSSATDLALGTAETARDVVWSAFAFPAAKLVKQTAMTSQQWQQKFGWLPEQTQEETIQMGRDIEEFIMTAGGLSTPTTKTGQAAMEIIGAPFEMVAKGSHAGMSTVLETAGISKKESPLLHEMMGENLEVALLMLLPGLGRKAKSVGKKIVKAKQVKANQKAKAQQEATEASAKLVKEMEKELAKEEKLNSIREYQKQVIDPIKEKQAKLGAKAELARIQREPGRAPEIRAAEQRRVTSQEQAAAFEGAEIISKEIADIRAREPQPGFVPQTQPGPVRGETPVRRGDLGPEPVSALDTKITPEKAPSHKVEFLSEEGLPKMEYQIDPETGKISESYKATERKAYQVDPETGKVREVESVPGKKNIWQIIIDPIKNEGGYINIDPKELFRTKDKILKAFHGTSKGKIKNFDNSLIQKNEHGWSGAGHYFTTNKETADLYSQISDGVSKQNLIEVAFSFKNPIEKFSPQYEKLLKEATGKTSITTKADGIKATEAFKKAGYDAVIVDKLDSPYNEINVFDSKNIHILEQSIEPATKGIVNSLLDPLRNEQGFIKIPRRRKDLIKNVPENVRENIRRFAEIATKQGKTFEEFLESTGFDKKQKKQLVKFYKVIKEDRPLGAIAITEPVKQIKGAFDPYKKVTGKDPKVNISKDANEYTNITVSDVRKFANLEKLPIGGLIQSLRTPQTFFSQRPKIKALLDQARKNKVQIQKEKVYHTKFFKSLEKKYSNKKYRKEAGVLQHSLSESGLKAMQKLGHKINPEAKYKGINQDLKPFYDDLVTRINEQRTLRGKRLIPKMDNYMPFIARESLFAQLRESIHGKEDFNGYKALFSESLDAIQKRHEPAALDSAAFHHLSRQGLRSGVKLELDPLINAQRYAQESMAPIHHAKLNTFIKEIMTKDLTLPNGQKINFKHYNPGLAAELISWSNDLAGKSNLPLPRELEKPMRKLSSNLTRATLIGNPRTTGIQLTALLPTLVEMPMATQRGIFSYLLDLGKKKKSVPVEKSNVLPDAVLDAAFDDLGQAIGGTKFQKSIAGTTNIMGFLMRHLDKVARDITFRAKYKQLEKSVKKGTITKEQAIKAADDTVIRTQGSGAPGERAPIQRNMLGRVMTLWQTFTINNVNWIAKEVLGVKNPEATPTRTAGRVFSYLLGLHIMGEIFESNLGIQSPGPAVVQQLQRQVESGEKDPVALALGVARESAELVPFGGSIKFGSSPLGAVVDFIGSVSDIAAGTSFFDKDLIVRAKQGDKKAIIKLLETAGKATGFPGAGTIAKTARGLLRNENIGRAMIGRIPEMKKKSSSRKSKRNKRKRRSTK